MVTCLGVINVWVILLFNRTAYGALPLSKTTVGLQLFYFGCAFDSDCDYE